MIWATGRDVDMQMQMFEGSMVSFTFVRLSFSSFKRIQVGVSKGRGFGAFSWIKASFTM